MAPTIGELVGFIDLDNKGFKDGLDQSESDFKGFGGRLGTAATAAGVAAGAALAVGLAEAMDIERANSRITAQLNLTAAESERVGGVAGDLYADAFGENIGQVNDALRGIIAQTGELGDISDEELTRMGEAALSLADILETDVIRVTQIAGQAVRDGLAKDMTEAFDLIARASQETMPGLQQDVLDAVDEYGTFFATLGIDGPQAFGILAAASEQGQFGIDKTGDALKEFVTLATETGGTAAVAFESMGLNAQDMANDILAGGDTAAEAFDKTIDGLLAIEDPAAQAQAAVDLFGTPIEDLNKADIPEFLANMDSTESSLGDVSGAAADVADELGDNTATSFTSLGRSAKQDLGEALAPLLPLLEKMLEFLIPLTPILGPIAIAIGVLTAAQWALNIAMAANPIGLIILAILALIAIVVLLVVYWDEFVGGLLYQWELLKDGATKVWGAIKDFFVMIGTSIRDFFVGIWNSITEFLTGIWNGIKSFFTSIWNAIVNSVRTQVQIFLSIIDWFKELPGKVKAWFGALKDAAVNKLVELVSWAKGLPGRISDALGNIKDKLLDKGKDLITGLLDGMKNAAGAVKDWVMGLLGDIADSVKDFFGISSPSKLMMGFGENIGDGLAKGIRASVGQVNVASDVLASAAMPGDASGSRASMVNAQFTEADRELLSRVAASMPRIDVRTFGPGRAEINRQNAMLVA